jgi:hypothetical protein
VKSAGLRNLGIGGFREKVRKNNFEFLILNFELNA